MILQSLFFLYPIIITIGIISVPSPVTAVRWVQIKLHGGPRVWSEFMRDETCARVKLPSTFLHVIKQRWGPESVSTHQIHNYNTRSPSAGNYYTNYSRTNQYKDSFARIGAKIWNSIQENLRNLPKLICCSNSLFFIKKKPPLLKSVNLIGTYWVVRLSKL